VHPFRCFFVRLLFPVSVHTSVCTTFLSILRPCIRCSVRPASILLRARLLCVYLSVRFFVRSFIRFWSVNLSVPSFNFPSVPSFIWSFVYSLFVGLFISLPVCFALIYPSLSSSVFSLVLVDSVIHPLIPSISHPFLHLFGHSCTHCLSSLPMVYCFARFRLSDRTFAYPLSYSSSYRSFTRRNCNSFYFRACIVMFADNHLPLKKHCAISFIQPPSDVYLSF